ncbi:hypothetical protein CHS0354_033793 [Potamilus streckersoni]|uniref:EF-hand domain-containing protein n=1 Tax=Potamilus streckersoni TaxID=2493646 RepID=A0AAE0VUV4_9BIVA|nr:hypothetical protein CHS0354_033793 [Potamilus streckersoni]
MSSVKTSSPTRSLRDVDKLGKDPETSRTPDKTEKQEKHERKVVNVDNKMENRLNMKDLEKLQDAFMSEGDGYDNKLSLNREQFCEALTIILGRKGNREEYGELFDKVDVTREGTVDWDKFASHMLLEFYERDDRVKSTQVPQWKDLKTLPSPHKELIQRVCFLKNMNKYISISKEGTIGFWGVDMKLQRAFKTGTDSCKARDLWVTQFVVLQNINKVALTFTSKEIAIYDLSSKVEFSCQYKVQGLSFTPLSIDYWFNPMNPNDAIIVFGDVGGYVNCLFFNSALIALFERPPAPAGEKQETCLNVLLSDVAIDKYKNCSFTRYLGHDKEWVRQVKYCQGLECFISCATSYATSLVIGWMEKHTSSNQSAKSDVWRYVQGNVTQRKELLRSFATFTIPQGINAFDVNEQMNLIATAGVNHHVCLWNPYVVSKPNGVLRGHMAGVVQVQFLKSRGQLISFSKDKILRIWDVQLQVCIQRLAGMFPKGPEVYSALFFDEGKDRNGQERNRLFISFNYQLTVMEMKLEIKDRVLSHEKPVVAAINNSVYNQVVSVCQGGTIIMWMIDTGQKVKQFNGIHGNSEVTCLSQDQSETRLFTGSTDGTVKVWDFNGNCFHTLSCAGGQPADVGQILNLKRCVLVVGWAKYITVFRNTSFRDFHVQPSDWKGGQEHSEDILAAGFQPPNLLATGSYDGEIVIWNTNSEHASKHFNQRSLKLLKSRGRTFVTNSREITNVSLNSRPKSRPKSRTTTSRVSIVSSEEQNEFGSAIAKLLFLEARKGHSAGGGANLVSCGGNGWVRFWNTAHCQLVAEFIAHHHAGSILMATDKKNQFLVTGDVDGLIKVWKILEYATHQVDEPITDQPPHQCQFHAHQDMINSLEICERNERIIIISASSDCSVAMWDVFGNRIGVFGQEEHWKIEPYDPTLEMGPEIEDEEKLDEEKTEIMTDDDSQWEPDDDPLGTRYNTWASTILGKDYQELRSNKRERRQPGTIPDLPYLHWEKTGQAPAGPYSALETQDLQEVPIITKPDSDKYFLVRPPSVDISKKLPALAETLKTAYDEKSLFPTYIREFEMRMKTYHHSILQGESKGGGLLSKTRPSLQQLGLQLNQVQKQAGTKSSSTIKARGLAGLKLQPVARSRTSSVTTES